MFSKSSQYYTGKINLKHAIQRRLLRSFHADSHYCNALFRYMREMAIQHKENCLFVSCNDKAKVDYGEPGTALSTGVRVKKSLVSINSTLGALDHEVTQKGNVTSAVSLLRKVPDSIDELFYRGTPIVTLKDSVF